MALQCMNACFPLDLSMVGAEAVLGEEQVLGPISPLLLPRGILEEGVN